MFPRLKTGGIREEGSEVWLGLQSLDLELIMLSLL